MPENTPISVPEEQQLVIVDLFNTANEDVRNILISLFGSDFLPLNIKEKVNDFATACTELNIDLNFISALNLTGSLMPNALISAIKLQIIIRALNQTWHPNLSDVNQKKYYVFPELQNGELIYFASNFVTTSVIVPDYFMLASEDLTLHLINHFKNDLDQYYMSAVNV